MKSKFYVLAVALGALVAFAGCKSVGDIGVDAPTPKIAVAEAHAAYTIAANAITDGYINQPECTNPVTVVPCSKATVVARIRAANTKAYAALLAADEGITSQNWTGSTADKALATAKSLLFILAAFEIDGAVTSTVDAATKSTLATAHAKAQTKINRVSPARLNADGTLAQ